MRKEQTRMQGAVRNRRAIKHHVCVRGGAGRRVFLWLLPECTGMRLLLRGQGVKNKTKMCTG